MIDLQQALNSVSDAPKQTREAMLAYFLEAAEEAMSNRLNLSKSVHDRGSGFTLRPSILGLPLMELAFGKLYPELYTEGCTNLDALDELFLDGNLVEAVFTAYIRGLFPEAQVQVPLYHTDYALRGHADLILDDVVYDIKSTPLGGKLRRSSSSGQYYGDVQVVGVTNPCHISQVVFYADACHRQAAGLIIVDKITKSPHVILLSPERFQRELSLIRSKVETLAQIETEADIVGLPYPTLKEKGGSYYLPSWLKNYGRYYDLYFKFDSRGKVTHYKGINGGQDAPIF